MHYISEVSTINGVGGDRIKKMLLESNPLLEGFSSFFFSKKLLFFFFLIFFAKFFQSFWKRQDSSK